MKTYRALVPLTAVITFEASSDKEAARIADLWYDHPEAAAQLGRAQRGWMPPDEITLMNDETEEEIAL